MAALLTTAAAGQPRAAARAAGPSDPPASTVTARAPGETLALPPRVVWSHKLDSDVWGRATVHDGRVYFGSHGKKLHCLDSRDGKLLWQADLAERTVSRPVISGRRVFMSCHKDYVYAFDTLTGKELWKIAVGPEGSATTALVIGDMVFFGAYDKTFRGLSAATGQVRWTCKGSSSFISTPVRCGREIAFCDAQRVYLADPESGQVRVTMTPGGELQFNVSACGDRVYVGADASLLCYSRKEGQLLWSYSCGWGNNGGKIVERDGVCYFLGGGKLHALQADEGKVRWVRHIGEGPGCGTVWGTPLVAGRHVLVPGKRLTCLNIDDGTTAWTFKGNFMDSPVIHQGRAYAGTWKDRIFLCLEEDVPGAMAMLGNDATEFVSQDRTRELVRRLGDSDWQIRKKATEDLIAMGTSVRGELQAVKTDDAEVAMRIEMILESLGGGDTCWTTILDAADIERLASAAGAESLPGLAKMLKKALGDDFGFSAGPERALAALRAYLAAHPRLTVRAITPRPAAP